MEEGAVNLRFRDVWEGERESTVLIVGGGMLKGLERKGVGGINAK